MNETAADEAFRRLYDDHHRAVLAYFLRRTDREAAYECTEDVFLVAWRRPEKIPEGEAALAWLYAVAKRVLANQRRGAARRARLNRRLLGMGPAMPQEPEPQVIRHAEHDEVLAAIEELSVRDQEVIRLAYWDELPHALIAELEGCSVGTVDVRLHRAVRRLEKGLRRTGHRHHETPAFLTGEERE